jgi:hypothetical protein
MSDKSVPLMEELAAAPISGVVLDDCVKASPVKLASRSNAPTPGSTLALP